MQKVYRCLRSNFQIVNFNGNSFFNRLLGNGRSNLHDADGKPPGNFNFDKMNVQDLCPCVCARMYSPFCPSFAYLIIYLIDNFFSCDRILLELAGMFQHHQRHIRTKNSREIPPKKNQKDCNFTAWSGQKVVIRFDANFVNRGNKPLSKIWRMQKQIEKNLCMLKLDLV